MLHVHVHWVKCKLYVPNPILNMSAMAALVFLLRLITLACMPAKINLTITDQLYMHLIQLYVWSPRPPCCIFFLLSQLFNATEYGIHSGGHQADWACFFF